LKFRKILDVCILILFLVSFLFSTGCAKKEQANILKEATETDETTIKKSTIEENTEEETPQWKEILDEATKLYEEGDFGEAKKLLKEVLKMDPDNKVSKETIPTPIAYEIVIKKRRFCFNFGGSKINEKGSPLNITNNNPKNNLIIVIILIF